MTGRCALVAAAPHHQEGLSESNTRAQAVDLRENKGGGMSI